MASSGSFYTNYEGLSSFRLKFSWSASQSVTANTSTVSWSVSLTDGDGSSWVYCGPITAWVGGVKYELITGRQKCWKGTLFSKTTTIKHNSNGTGSFYAEVQGAVNAYAISNKGHASYTLNTIPRASSVSVNGTIVVGDWWSVNVKRQSTSFKDDIWYRIQVNKVWQDWVLLKNDWTGGTYKWYITGNTAKTLEAAMKGASSVPIEFEVDTYNGSTKVGAGTTTVTLKSGKNSVSATSANIGETSTISISKSASPTTTKVDYQFGSATGTLTTGASGTDAKSLSWKIPTSLYANIPNASSGTCTLTATTYSDGIEIGKKTNTFTISVDKSINAPLLSPVIEDTDAVINNLTGDTTTLVKYFSDAKITINAAAKNSATIKSTWASCGSQKLNGDGVMKNITSDTFTVGATDSRDISASKIVKAPFVEYVKPTCVMTLGRPTTEGLLDITIEGSYFDKTFGSNPNAVHNTLTVQYRYYGEDNVWTEWTTVVPKLHPGGVYDYRVNTKVEKLDYKQAYTFEARAIDKLTTATANPKTVRALPVFDWGEKDFRFNVPVKMSEGGLEVIKLRDVVLTPPSSPDFSEVSCELYCIPAIRMIWGRIKALNNHKIFAGNAYEVGTISERKYHPIFIVALATSNKYPSEAYILDNGKVYIRCNESKSDTTNYVYYLTGMWMY